ncbi:MAG: plasmid mobilization relaxosome protein MobC [Oscillospiraceae bacterium]|nr:plasmid mobilization relaxosome protein MobC [Oscillospiraceae bacterium]
MKRNITKLIRFSENEWKNVERRAAIAGMKPAVFIRNMAENGQIRLYDLEKYQNLSYPMRGISSNMNQIAMVANINHFIFEKDVSNLRDHNERLKRMFDAFFADALTYEAV